MRPASSWERAVECSRAALDRKAQELVVLATRELTSIADYFVICSGRSDTQVQAITDAIEAHLSALGERPLHVEGREHGQWVLIDFGDDREGDGILPSDFNSFHVPTPLRAAEFVHKDRKPAKIADFRVILRG